MPALGVNSTWGQQTWATYVLEHLVEQSALLRAGARFVPINGRVAHIPRTLSDGLATWTAEGTEITSNAPTGDELVLTPKKLANVVSLSNESLADAPVSELDEVGIAITRGVANAMDATALSASAATAVAPAGLLSYAIPAQTGGTVTVDPYIQAISKIEAVGGLASVILLNPADKAALSLLKEATGSSRPLLQPDPTKEGALSIGGAALISTSAIAAGKALVAEARQIVVGVRHDVDVQFSDEAKFTSDSTVARVVARFDWGFNDIRGAVLVGT